MSCLQIGRDRFAIVSVERLILVDAELHFTTAHTEGRSGIRIDED